MKTALTILRTVAAELAATAKSHLPKLQEGEKVIREILKDGIYTRETSLGNRHQFDFRQNKSGDDDKERKSPSG